MHAFAKGLVVFGTGADYTDSKVRGKRRAVACLKLLRISVSAIHCDRLPS